MSENSSLMRLKSLVPWPPSQAVLGIIIWSACASKYTYVTPKDLLIIHVYSDEVYWVLQNSICIFFAFAIDVQVDL